MTDRRPDRAFTRSFFTSPTAVEGEEDSAKMLRGGVGLRGFQAPDVWVPDNEDATAPSMRDEGVENIIEVVAEDGAEFPGEIHPRIVWHRDSPEIRYQGFQHMLAIADPDRGAIEHIDGFVVPEVGGIDDWKKADEFFTIVERESDLPEGSLAMSVVVESAVAELALNRLREEMSKPTNNLERLFLLVDGEVDYTKDMRAITPTGALPPWPTLRHNTSRGASAAGLIAVDGPYDDIRDIVGYRDRITDNQEKGMLGIWSLTPQQVVEANKAPLPPETGLWILDDGREEVELEPDGDSQVYQGDRLSLRESEGDYVLGVGQDEVVLTEDELREELLDRVDFVPGLIDIVESMEAFEEAKAAGTGAISQERQARIRVDDIEMLIQEDRMWDEATYQAAMTPIKLFQDVHEHRSDQRAEMIDEYGESVVDRAMRVGE